MIIHLYLYEKYLYLYLYNGDLPGVLPDPFEIHGEALEDDDIFVFVLEIFVFIIV